MNKKWLKRFLSPHLLRTTSSYRIKKEFSVILFILLFHSPVFGQNNSVSLFMKDATLEQIFDKIEQDFKYTFIYIDNVVDVNRKVDINVQSESIQDVLNILFKQTDIQYNVVDKQIILSKQDDIAKSSQEVRITGKISDAAGEPLIGASIIEKGTTNGTLSDMDGNFTLNLPANSVLQVSYIGYDNQDIVLGNKTHFDIVLRENVKAIDEVVVVGYGVQKKANLTGAVNSVKMEEVLGDRPVVSISNALMGAMPGLQITGTSGSPGSEMNFNIRGVNSINGGSPLVLVDNVEMDINMLDPNDIESISLLKDAASAAIYGARAAFGVVLVTTKKGAENTNFSLNYSNNFSFSRASNLPHKATPLQTVQAYKDMGTVSYTSGQHVDTWLDLLKEYAVNPNAYPDGHTYVGSLRYNLAETDLIGDMLETGFQQTHNLAMSGGNKNISYRLSAGLVDQNGILVTDKDSYKRYNISSYIRSDACSWLTPEMDVKYASSSNSMPYTTAPYGIWGAAVAFPSYFPTGTMEIDGETLPVNTPRTMIDLASTRNSDVSDLRIFNKITVTPFKNMKVIGEYAFNRKTRDINTFNKKFYYAHGTQFSKDQSVSNSEYKVENQATNYNAINIYGNYNISVKKHDLGVMAGFNQESNSYKMFYASRTDMINEDLPSLSQATGDYYNKDEFKRFTVRGLFYRINYSYNGKYLLETNGRYDGSSKFPSKNRFGFFPSLSVGWRISEENFMAWSTPLLSNLKLRASYGTIGNQSIKPYEFVPGMNAADANWIVNGLVATTLNPPALVSQRFTWEKVSTLDFGADLGLFNNRLNLVFDWYQRDTKGMLAPGMELPGVLGASAPLQNTANLRSKGWELSLDWNDQIGKVRYYVGFNLYDARTKITKYNNEAGLLGDDIYRKGMELGEIWGYVTDRFYTQDDFNADGSLKEGIAKIEGYNPNPGDVLYVDFDKNGIINNGKNTETSSGDRRIIGNNKRRYQYGIRAGLTWKGISFSTILQGVGKRDLWIMNELFYPHYDAWSTLYDSQLDYWTPENTDSYFPRLYEKAEGNTAANRRVQTKYLQNGAYLTVRNITLSYDFPKQWIKHLQLSNLSLFFSGENLLTFDHLPKGLDAERVVTDDLGARGFTYPYMKQYSFGIRLNLK